MKEKLLKLKEWIDEKTLNTIIAGIIAAIVLWALIIVLPASLLAFFGIIGFTAFIIIFIYQFTSENL